MVASWLLEKIKKGLFLSFSVNFLIGEYFAKLKEKTWLSRALCAPGHRTAKDEESARDNHVLALPNIRFKKFTADSAINLS